MWLKLISTNSQTHIAHVASLLIISVQGQSTSTQDSNLCPKYEARFGMQFVILSTCAHLTSLTALPCLLCWILPSLLESVILGTTAGKKSICGNQLLRRESDPTVNEKSRSHRQETDGRSFSWAEMILSFRQLPHGLFRSLWTAVTTICAMSDRKKLEKCF